MDNEYEMKICHPAWKLEVTVTVFNQVTFPGADTFRISWTGSPTLVLVYPD